MPHMFFFFPIFFTYLDRILSCELRRFEMCVSTGRRLERHRDRHRDRDRHHRDRQHRGHHRGKVERGQVVRIKSYIVTIVTIG